MSDLDPNTASSYRYVEESVTSTNDGISPWAQILRVLDDEEFPLKQMTAEDLGHLFILLTDLRCEQGRDELGRLRELVEKIDPIR